MREMSTFQRELRMSAEMREISAFQRELHIFQLKCVKERPLPAVVILCFLFLKDLDTVCDFASFKT